MAKKTYRTYFLKGLQLILKGEDGKRIEIVFRGGSQIDSTARFTTADEAIQNKLESLPGFNKTYYVESEKETEAKEEAKKAEPAPEKQKAEKPQMSEVKDVKRFRNLVEMKNAMEELGFKDVQGMNYMQAKAAAQKEGYDFQIQR